MHLRTREQHARDHEINHDKLDHVHFDGREEERHAEVED